MAHELDFSNGRANFAFSGERSNIWHRLGQTMNGNHTLMDWAREGGLQHTVAKAYISYKAMLADGTVSEITCDDAMVTYRTDTGLRLGNVSDSKYSIEGIQPLDILKFFEEFLTENGLKFSTVGSLRGGRIVFALADLGPDFMYLAPGGGVTKFYVRLQTSYDGSRATSLVITAIRQVCANTEAAVEAATKGKQFRVTHSQVFDKRGLQAAFGLLGEQYRMTVDLWNALQERKVTAEECRHFFCELLNVKSEDLNRITADGKPVVPVRTQNQLVSLAAAYTGGPGANEPKVYGTAYGLLQSVTHWVDHQASTRDTTGDGKENSRLASAWYGNGAAVKARARVMLADLSGIKTAA